MAGHLVSRVYMILSFFYSVEQVSLSVPGLLLHEKTLVVLIIILLQVKKHFGLFEHL